MCVLSPLTSYRHLSGLLFGFMSSLLLKIPDDILIFICISLPVQDVLSLQLVSGKCIHNTPFTTLHVCDTQTCRALHHFCASDYIWHNLKFDLPLDIPPHIDPNALSGIRLRRLYVQALRVEHNWTAPISRVRSMHRVYHGDIVFQTMYLGIWLLTLSRPSAAMVCHLSVWNVDDASNPKRERSIILENTQKARFSAILVHDNLELTIAVYGTSNRADKECVYMSTFCLQIHFIYSHQGQSGFTSYLSMVIRRHLRMPNRNALYSRSMLTVPFTVFPYTGRLSGLS
jgi:hypothetical protein